MPRPACPQSPRARARFGVLALALAGGIVLWPAATPPRTPTSTAAAPLFIAELRHLPHARAGRDQRPDRPRPRRLLRPGACRRAWTTTRSRASSSSRSRTRADRRGRARTTTRSSCPPTSSPARTPRTSPPTSPASPASRAPQPPQLAPARAVHRALRKLSRAQRGGHDRHHRARPRRGARRQGREVHRAADRRPELRDHPGLRARHHAPGLRHLALAAGRSRAWSSTCSTTPASSAAGRAATRAGRRALGLEVDDHVGDRERDLALGALDHPALEPLRALGRMGRDHQLVGGELAQGVLDRDVGIVVVADLAASAEPGGRHRRQRAPEPLVRLGDRAVDVVGEVLEPRRGSAGTTTMISLARPSQRLRISSSSARPVTVWLATTSTRWRRRRRTRRPSAVCGSEPRRAAPQQADSDPDLDRQQDRPIDRLGRSAPTRDHRRRRDPDDHHDAEHLGL